MRVLFIILLVLLSDLFVFGQEFKPVSNIPECKKNIQNYHASMKSLVADFGEIVYSQMLIQPQKGSGKIYYKQVQKIRWEHNDPKKKIILISGKSFRMNENGKEVVGNNIKTVGKKIQDIMIKMLTGEFLNEKDFGITYYESGKQYKLLLRPKNNQMAKYISEIQLLFDKKSLILAEMSMIENEKEKVVYTFTNYQFNQIINDSKFYNF